MKTKHPTQPLVRKDGVVRFKENAIVRYLLDAGKISMNDLAVMPFDRDDRNQFAQLIGYSLCGYGDLSYVSDKAYKRAEREGRINLDEVLNELQNSLEARCEACCRGHKHDDKRCGAPTARRLLRQAGRLHDDTDDAGKAKG
jgi:hypothetical protein